MKKIKELGGCYNNPVHYSKLIDTIFNEEIIEKYRLPKLNKMATSYLGKMCKKELICSGYNVVANYAYYIGHFLMSEGGEILNKLEKN